MSTPLQGHRSEAATDKRRTGDGEAETEAEKDEGADDKNNGDDDDERPTFRAPATPAQYRTSAPTARQSSVESASTVVYHEPTNASAAKPSSPLTQISAPEASHNIIVSVPCHVTGAAVNLLGPAEAYASVAGTALRRPVHIDTDGNGGKGNDEDDGEVEDGDEDDSGPRKVISVPI